MACCRAAHRAMSSTCLLQGKANILLSTTCENHLVQILICQNLRNNLQHPNEYIRGATLRFLCRIREEEILEPLIPSILSCLEHRNSFVRKNAVLAINALYKLPKGEHLLQDAPELIEKASPDTTCNLQKPYSPVSVGRLQLVGTLDDAVML